MWRDHFRLGPITVGARRGLMYLVALTAVLVAGSYYLGARSVNELRDQQHAACKFYADLGGAPVAANPATGKPSLLGVTIVSDARVTWARNGCPGRLQPADPSFTKWAARYGLPTR